MPTTHQGPSAQRTRRISIRPSCLPQCVKYAVVLICLATVSQVVTPANAATGPYYWDTNGAPAGAGATPSGTWGTNAYWNTDSSGLFTGTTETATLATDDLYFVVAPSASSGNGNATPGVIGSYTISLTGTQLAQ